jgi:hypothetical protein
MTTGRINQVTVLHTQAQRAHARRRVLGLDTLPPARVSHRPIKSSLRRRATRTAPSRAFRPAAPQARVPSPPISHASGALPRSVGPESTPSVKTTGERPHLRGGLPERGVSSIGCLQTVLAIGHQVHIPLHRSQQRQRRSARPLPGSVGLHRPQP